MNITDLLQLLEQFLIEEALEDHSHMEDFSVKRFNEAGILTKDQGFVIQNDDGVIFYITVT